MIDSGTGKQLAASSLSSEREMKRICAIERDAKTQCEISFKESSVEANEVGPILVKNARFDPLEKTRPFE
jgi:hypothetical protein